MVAQPRPAKARLELEGKEVPVLVVQAEQDASGVVHCGVIGVELVVHPTAEILGGIEPFSGQR